MQYACLIYPHANIRYRASLRKITAAELTLILKAIRRDVVPEEEERGGAAFLTFDTPEFSRRDIGYLWTTAGAFLWFEKDGENLHLLPGEHPSYVGEDLALLLKYKGKTNEMFTDAMIGMALAVSDFQAIYDAQLVVCDPMAGKGTTLFLALRRGFHSIGLELNRHDVGEATQFLNRYLTGARMKFKHTEISQTIRGKQGALEQKWVLSDTPEHFRDGDTRTLRFLQADTRDAGLLLKKETVHLMVTDLPYGVQTGTAGKADTILGTVKSALPGYLSALKPGGVLAMSFNTYVTKRQDLLQAGADAGFEPVETPDLSHWVEQAIDRDVVLLKKKSLRKGYNI